MHLSQFDNAFCLRSQSFSIRAFKCAKKNSFWKSELGDIGGRGFWQSGWGILYAPKGALFLPFLKETYVVKGFAYIQQ